jgi:hypothetical protein
MGMGEDAGMRGDRHGNSGSVESWVRSAISEDEKMRMIKRG